MFKTYGYQGYSAESTISSYSPRYNHSASSRDKVTYYKMSQKKITALRTEIEQGQIVNLDCSEKGLADQEFLAIVRSAVSRQSNVISLDFSNNNIGDIAIRELFPLLSHDIKIRELHLAYNQLTEMSVPSLLKIMEKNFTLQIMNVFQNKISQEHLRSLSKFLDRNRQIQEELSTESSKIEYYRTISESLEIMPASVKNIVLDYFNESLYPEARKVIQERLYSLPLRMGVKTVDSIAISVQEAVNFIGFSEQARALTTRGTVEPNEQAMEESHLLLERSEAPLGFPVLKICDYCAIL